MTDTKNMFDDIIKPLASVCSPLRITVKLKIVKDRYYIHFDGSKTYDDPENWDKFWTGFDRYIAHLLRLNNIEIESIKPKSNCCAVACIGTLFSMLKR